MRTYTTATQAVCLVIVSCFLTACGKDSASGLQTTSLAPVVPLTKDIPDAPRVDITETNYVSIASSALKSILLSDASATAMDQAVNVTQSKNTEVAQQDSATGVVLTFRPMPCLVSGDFTMDAEVESATDQLQVGLQNQLNLLFNSYFNDCDLGYTRLAGSLSLSFKAVLNDLLNGVLYNFEGNVGANELWITQEGFFPFTFDGELNYRLWTPDGNLITTEVRSESLRYSADATYQVENFESVKKVNLGNQSYSYQIHGSYVEIVDEQVSTFEYSTISPLSGHGFSVPSAGLVAVHGEHQILLIQVLNQDVVELSLDADTDGVVDHVYLTTWQELVLDDIGTIH